MNDASLLFPLFHLYPFPEFSKNIHVLRGK